ncbi:MAG: excisionase family DNA-binding protein [Thermoleophilia bacterium]|nr:excisionase family DNA-binding protein [Thermoleophilia bacterium]
MERELLTVREVAGRLRCSEETVRRMIARSDLAAVRVGRGYLVDAGSIPRPAYRHADERSAA